MTVLVTPEGTFEDIVVALTIAQCAMLRSLVYDAIKHEDDPGQVDFLGTLVEQLEQAEGAD